MMLLMRTFIQGNKTSHRRQKADLLIASNIQQPQLKAVQYFGRCFRSVGPSLDSRTAEDSCSLYGSQETEKGGAMGGDTSFQVAPQGPTSSDQAKPPHATDHPVTFHKPRL